LPSPKRCAAALVPLLAFIARPAASPTFEHTVQPFFAKNCYSCHNAKGNSGGLNLQDFNSPLSVVEYRDEWEKILARVSAGQMPPRSMPRPDPAEVKQVTDWVRAEFERADREAARRPIP
jgi:mono/diheme cytochrome c family protein